MPRHVAFLRAVNVGGRFVTMAGLRKALADSGFDPVETHIQSGNVLVGTRLRSGAKVEVELERVLGAWAGFDIPCIVRPPARLRALVAAVDGIPPILSTSARRYVAFGRDTVPAAAAAELEAWDKPGERARVIGKDVVAELTVDFHRLRLTNARIERITGTTMTWRDVKVVRAVAEKWGA